MAKNDQKKPVKQEPPAEQPPEQEEPVRPMAVQPPTVEERMEALEIRLKVTEEFCTRHNRYHFGREVSQG